MCHPEVIDEVPEDVARPLPGSDKQVAGMSGEGWKDYLGLIFVFAYAKDREHDSGAGCYEYCCAILDRAETC